MRNLLPTKIVDKNGKHTTVHKKSDDPASARSASRIAKMMSQTPKAAKPSKNRYFEETNHFYVSQRMTSISKSPRHQDMNTDDRKGIDKHFTYSYMGSAEYEWGAAGDSLKRIRDSKRLETASVEIEFQGVTKTVHFAGIDITPKVEKFTRWMTEGRRGAKENSFFTNKFTGDGVDYELEKAAETDAWWSLRGDVLFTMNDDDFTKIVEGIIGESKQKIDVIDIPKQTDKD